MWMWIAIIMFWLLCGQWAIRMEEKDTKIVLRGGHIFIICSIGCFALLIAFCEIWIPRLWRFIKGIRMAWKQALKG